MKICIKMGVISHDKGGVGIFIQSGVVLRVETPIFDIIQK